MKNTLTLLCFKLGKNSPNDSTRCTAKECGIKYELLFSKVLFLTEKKKGYLLKMIHLFSLPCRDGISADHIFPTRCFFCHCVLRTQKNPLWNLFWLTL